MNAAVAGAAAADGNSSYVDTYTPSLGHDACAGAAAWINGKSILLTAAPYHPNFNGETALAKIVYAALR
jgi:hypothetical protein